MRRQTSRHRIERTRQGQPEHTALLGDWAIGKTTLLMHWRRLLRGAGDVVVLTMGLPADSGPVPQQAGGRHRGRAGDRLVGSARSRGWPRPRGCGCPPASTRPLSRRLARLAHVRETGRRDELRGEPAVAAAAALQGLGPELQFGPIEAAGILDAAEQAGFQLVVVDLGTQLEDGHRHLIGQADAVLGVVTPRVEALPDVLRITSYVRALGAGRKLGLVANEASDEGSLPTLADGEQVPIVATVPRLEAFDAAGDRGVPAWTDDPDAEHVLRPLATAAWPLFPGVPSSSDLRFHGVVSTVRRLLRARGGRS